MIFRSLFGKIFLCFWLTMIAIVIATAMSGAFLHNRFGRDRFEAHFTATQAAYAKAAGAILASEGFPGLETWLQQLRGPGGLPGRQMIFAANGELLFGRRGAKDLRDLVMAADPDSGERMPINRVSIEPIFLDGEQSYWFVTDMRHRRPPASGPIMRRGGPHPLPALVLLITVAIFVSGIICYALARYLTRPIRQMQLATKQIAAGDFAARVNINTTPRKDELGELSRDFDIMAEKLSRLQQAQAALVRDVSHELRSPLARLQVALGLAEQRDNGAAGAELKRIEQEVAVLDDLVDQLLSVARLEAAGQSAHVDLVDLGKLIDVICTDASYEGREQNKEVVFTTDAQISLRGDASLLRSAFENVIRNALRHTPANSSVVVTAEISPERRFIIRVRDAGPGVPEEQLQDMFKPFVRVETARDRDSGGFGLGLAIASAAVRGHGGEITAHNHHQGGLEVVVTLPQTD